jgi:hypothetical protein
VATRPDQPLRLPVLQILARCDAFLAHSGNWPCTSTADPPELPLGRQRQVSADVLSVDDVTFVVVQALAVEPGMAK